MKYKSLPFLFLVLAAFVIILTAVVFNGPPFSPKADHNALVEVVATTLNRNISSYGDDGVKILFHTRPVRDQEIEYILRLKCPIHVAIADLADSEMPMINSVQLARFTQTSNLVHLTTYGVQLSHADVEAVAHIEGLRVVTLMDCGIDDDDARVLLSLNRRLFAANTTSENLTDAGRQILRSNGHDFPKIR